MSFAGAKTPFDIQSMILGPDGMPYVLDKASNTVYRIDLRTKKATPVFKQKTQGGRRDRGRSEAARDGRPRPADHRRQEHRSGAGAPRTRRATARSGRSRSPGAPGWGDDVVAAGTFLRDATEGLYNLYIVDPSEQNILAYTPARDGSGFPVNPQNRLTVARDVSKVERPRDRRRHLRRRRRVARTGSSAARARAGRRSRRATRATPGTATRSSARPRTTPISRPRATSGPASSTPGTRTTAGSSPTTRPRARSSSSTASPAAARHGTTSAGCTSCSGPGRRRRRRSSGRRRTA